MIEVFGEGATKQQTFNYSSRVPLFCLSFIFLSDRFYYNRTMKNNTDERNEKKFKRVSTSQKGCKINLPPPPARGGI